jgi:hypothetical protein
MGKLKIAEKLFNSRHFDRGIVIACGHWVQGSHRSSRNAGYGQRKRAAGHDGSPTSRSEAVVLSVSCRRFHSSGASGCAALA